MIEKRLAAELGVTGYAKPLCLKWTSNVTREEPNSQRVTFEVSGEEKGKRFMMRDVGTIESLDLPMQNAPIEKLVKCYNHLKGLPIRSYRNAIPQLLIGVDNLRLIVPLKVHEGVEGSPTATKTRLGWCIYGCQGNIEYHPRNYHVCECGGESEFNDAIKKYFSFEETGVKSVTSVASEEDKRALRIMKQTTVHVKDPYESGLLWKFDKFEFPDSYPMAYKRLQCLERRMAKDPALRENIERQLKEYQAKEYAHRATPEELASAEPRRTWYLPLGAVMNSNKPGKMRLIWDASAKVDGVSLNTFLLKGPDQVTSLPTVLFRFRRYRVAVSADIKEMFHQVKIRPEDRHAQRFLWRSNPTPEPEEFLMDVATFGSTCSPATAQYVKNTNAQLFAQTFPRAVEGIVLSHYVDDYLDSFHDEIEAKRVACEVKNIHDYGGFDLRNWCSNSLDVLQHLGEDTRIQLKQLNPEKDDHSERVLGMLWETHTDELRFSATLPGDIAHIVKTETKPTKSQILRCVMTLFDPLGLLAPFLVFGKMLIQSVWRLGIDWDDQVDDEVYGRWLQWIEMFNHINEIRIPRSYFRKAGVCSFRNIEIHTFVDAGKDACSCVVYFRIVNRTGDVEVALVAAKTKVAPLKPITVPRMELQACVLGARLAKFVIEGHAFPSISSYFWSDSSTALSWINADPRKYSPFVTFRVGEILENTNRADWRWVPSQQNPADEATKWGSGPYFNTHSIWYSGPDFLRLSKDNWPTWKPTGAGNEELRKCYVHHDAVRPEYGDFPRRFGLTMRPIFKEPNACFAINDGLASTFTSTQTAWKFIPPSAPHMGGAWERLVRTVKAGLAAAYNNEKLDDEALWTLLVEVECMVNSRPLTYLPLDSAEQEALTPNHFLLGSSSGVKQPPIDREWNSTYLKQSWIILQARLDAFWKRWISTAVTVGGSGDGGVVRRKDNGNEVMENPSEAMSVPSGQAHHRGELMKKQAWRDQTILPNALPERLHRRTGPSATRINVSRWFPIGTSEEKDCKNSEHRISTAVTVGGSGDGGVVRRKDNGNEVMENPSEAMSVPSGQAHHRGEY
ncbi:uncharacterized protein LOC129781728 [Toxorhynchites rutilus septentrionalis]|uniref:uncharacterized protein LOC129781728 n=1 Tax=Toxorhynchites rutilus septentrionalis TaxID=329112 RepID=UPI00247A72EE|nr:uncharacterized protein LOC129781728 [Toxorhynchites rutilus septentrionalis]